MPDTLLDFPGSLAWSGAHQLAGRRKVCPDMETLPQPPMPPCASLPPSWSARQQCTPSQRRSRAWSPPLAGCRVSADPSLRMHARCACSRRGLSSRGRCAGLLYASKALAGCRGTQIATAVHGPCAGPPSLQQHARTECRLPSAWSSLPCAAQGPSARSLETATMRWLQALARSGARAALGAVAGPRRAPACCLWHAPARVAAPQASCAIIAGSGRSSMLLWRHADAGQMPAGHQPGVCRFWESWSSITTLYRHIFNSVSVRDIYRSEGFQAGFLRNASVDGPFKARLPASQRAPPPPPNAHLPAVRMPCWQPRSARAPLSLHRSPGSIGCARLAPSAAGALPRQIPA